MLAVVKYFIYISKGKVDMLSAQLHKSGFDLTSITAKLGIGVGSLSIKAEKSDGELISLALKVRDALHRRKEIEVLEDGEPLKTSCFYQDQGKWRSGLLAFDTMFGETTVVYALWRPLGRSLIALVGSPNNVLGSKVVSGGCFVAGSGDAYLLILDFIDRDLTADECVMVCLKEPRPHRSTGLRFRDRTLPTPPLSVSPIIVPPSFEMANLERASKERFGLEFSLEKGRALGTLCLKNMGTFADADLEVLFRLFSEHPIPKGFGNTSWEQDQKRKMSRLGGLNYDKV